MVNRRIKYFSEKRTPNGKDSSAANGECAHGSSLTGTVDANAFWTELEYRVCREIDGLRTDEYRGLWCDGFIPERLELCDGRTCVIGRVWMGRGGRHQEQWQFTLHLPKGITTESEVAWASMFPPEEVNGWLSIDQNERRIEIDPAAAHADGRRE